MRISDWSSDVCSSDLIKPSRPETGYGYIEVEEGAVSQSEATDVRCFVEKPDLRTAEGFFQSGRHCWNEGIFLCSAKTLLREMERFAPETLQVARMATERAEKDRNFLRLARQASLRAHNIPLRSEERREGKELVSTLRTRWWPFH